MKMSYEDIIKAMTILNSIEEDLKDGESKNDIAKEYGLTIEQISTLHHKMSCLKL